MPHVKWRDLRSWPHACDNLTMHHLVRELIELDLSAGDWALFGSGPLLMRGWIDDVGDLDVISRGQAWVQAQARGTAVVLEYGAEIYQISEGITVGTSWAYGEMAIDELIETAETISGVPCVQLKHVVAYKLIADRPKDLAHLAVISERTE